MAIIEYSKANLKKVCRKWVVFTFESLLQANYKKDDFDLWGEQIWNYACACLNRGGGAVGVAVSTLFFNNTLQA